MSAPIVVYGHCIFRSGEMWGSGSKLTKSNGCAPVSEVRMFRHSTSSLVVGLIYPAVDNAGCRLHFGDRFRIDQIGGFGRLGDM